MPPPNAPARSRVAYTVWGAGMAAYVIAVAGRTSLGVAGLQAADRFEISAATLALFSVVQLAVYAAAQIPVGMLLDRVGSRRVIALGALLMAVGQLVLAVVDTLPMAISARVLIGLGDATAFVSVLRLVPSWFPASRVPLMLQMTGILGQAGQVISAVPFLALLLGAGWTPAFSSLAGAGLLTGVLAAALVRDRPRGRSHAEPRVTAHPEPEVTAHPEPEVNAPAPGAPPPAAGERVPMRAVLTEPGMWLGFFTHFVGLFPLSTFTLLWGVPFLTEGQGVSTAVASSLLTFSALVGVVVGPVMGVMQARHPLRRSWLVLGAALLVALAWAMVLVPSGPRPLWQLALLVVALAVSASSSSIGFDYARSFVPAARLGTANGVVNVGGFVASLVSIFAVGLVLDLVGSGATHTLDDFRIALSTQAVVWMAGLAGFLLTRRAARRRLAREGVVVPPVREVVARIRAERRRGQRRG